jgi:hypothetical protein
LVKTLKNLKNVLYFPTGMLLYLNMQESDN